MKRAAVLAVAFSAFALPAAQAKTPLPAKPQGAGSEPTAGGGVINGASFHARSAIVQVDSATGDVFVYVFSKKVGCRVISYSDAPYVWLWIHTNGTPLDVGKPLRTNGTVRFVQVNFVLSDHYIAVQPGVRLTFTRIDTRKSGVWHGRLTVGKQTVKGRAFSYGGTFAARWCGKA